MPTGIVEEENSMKNYFEELSAIMQSNPDLVFYTVGYQEIPMATIASNQGAFDKVTVLLKECVAGFVRFQNFKPRKDGTFAVRCQTRWSETFTGVSYFPLENFQPDSPTWVNI
jgi:hypothetical protein